MRRSVLRRLVRDAWDAGIQPPPRRRLRATAETGERQTSRDGTRHRGETTPSKPPTLKALGLTRDQSSDYQKLAAIPKDASRP